MAKPPKFFELNELSADADERTVKRAYARQLKKIDQENDLEGFQALRDSYEQALMWIKIRDQLQQHTNFEVTDKTPGMVTTMATTSAEVVAAVPDVPAQQSALEATQQAGTEDATNNKEENAETVAEPDTPEPINGSEQPGAGANAEEAVDTENPENPDAFQPRHETQVETLLSPHEVAQQVFAEMFAAIDAHADEYEFIRLCLLEKLEDVRLYHMETRFAFEQILAAHLAQGWRPGNDALFDLAVDCFGWRKDRRRMLGLGQPGYTLEQAFAEMTVFNKQESSTRDEQWEILLKLRNDRFPGAAYLQTHYKKLERIAEMYPVWIWIVSSKANFEIWKSAVSVAMSQAFGHHPSMQMDEPAPVSRPQKVLFSSPIFQGLKFLGKALVCIYLIGIAIWFVDAYITKHTPEPAKPQMSTVNGPAQKFDAAFNKLNDARADAASIQAAINSLEQLADSGYARASYYLGSIYEQNRAVGRDEILARKWLLKAAEQGHLGAKVALADHCMEGKGGGKDIAEALRWYRQAADQGYGLAQLRLAHLYINGSGVMKDTEKGLNLMSTAAAKGFSTAQTELGLIRLHGTYGSEKDLEKAAHWFMLSARQNDIIGQRMFGLVNYKGWGGFPINHTAAAVWFAKAAHQGDKEAGQYLQDLCKSDAYPECRYL